MTEVFLWADLHLVGKLLGTRLADVEIEREFEKDYRNF
jgi:hypothetical protein